MPSKWAVAVHKRLEAWQQFVVKCAGNALCRSRANKSARRAGEIGGEVSATDSSASVLAARCVAINNGSEMMTWRIT